MIPLIKASVYETGYADYHTKNCQLYKDIEKYFSGKKSVGVRVYESSAFG